jgi:[histone H3]-N6,N6-dimethyl-lysine9 N-methyltransferase
VFFDDGYAQYVRHEDVRVVCESSANVWEDVHIHSREFMANYLKTYRNERPMVQVRKGQKMITEYKGLQIKKNK